MDMEQHQEITNPDNITDSSNNNGGGLLIKLKMAKASPFSEPGNRKPETLAPRFPKICPTCQKGFVSGKALGGHMRMHAQESKGLIKSSSKSPKPNSAATEFFSASATDSGGEHVCIECGKIFPSKKSLYGHMRSHPDRPYRGIEPPPMSAKNSSTSTLSDALPQNNHKAAEDQQIDSAGTARVWFGPNPKAARDLVKVVPSWSQTAKRGRKGNDLDSETDSDSDDDCADDVDEEELNMSEAVQDLMMLAQANSKGAEEATNSNFMTKNNQDRDVKDTRVIDYLGTGKKRKKLIIEEDGGNDLELGLDLKHDSEELSDSENLESIVLANMMKRKKRRKMKLEDLDNEAVVVDHQNHQIHHHKVYTCNLCNKSFQSHQALGGHMSSHNKVKNNNHHHQSGSEDTNNANVNLTNTAATQVDIDQVESHQCGTCNRTFLTGQALGGHMRSHWNGPNDQAQSRQTGRKGLDIDLNEPPPMEYEQGIECYSGAGYATSYNSVTLS